MGIDEVGRGPLAGPVTVCAFIFSRNLEKKILREIFPNGVLKDSKKLSFLEREEVYKILLGFKKAGIVSWRVKSMSAVEIDKRGISACIKVLVRNLLVGIDPNEVSVLLDGGLKAPSEFFQKTIIKGDEKFLAISLASVVAKVTRDKFMNKAHVKIPNYAWAKNKGYGTREHIWAIRKNGLSDLHRRSFCRTIL